MVEHRDLESLIFQNCDARQYYNELSKHVRKRIKPHSSEINFYEALQEYVQKLNQS